MALLLVAFEAALALDAGFVDVLSAPSLSSVPSRSVTVPESPSTLMVWPDPIRVVAMPVPRTAGIPYSHATIEPWARMPPTSVTSPRAGENSGVHAGVVVGHTRIVPGSIREKSAGE